MGGRAPATRVGRGDVVGGVERDERREAGIAVVEDAVVFLLGRLRIVAQRLHQPRRLAPRAVQRDARVAEEDSAPRTHPDLRRPLRTRPTTRASRPCVRRTSRPRRRPSSDLDDGAQFFGEERRHQAVVCSCTARRHQSSGRNGRQRPSRERHDQAAVRPIVVGEYAGRRAASSASAVEEPVMAAGSSTSGASLPISS